MYNISTIYCNALAHNTCNTFNLCCWDDLLNVIHHPIRKNDNLRGIFNFLVQYVSLRAFYVFFVWSTQSSRVVSVSFTSKQLKNAGNCDGMSVLRTATIYSVNRTIYSD